MEALRVVFAKLGFEIETEKVSTAAKQFDSLVNRVTSAWVVFRSLSGAVKLVNDQIQQGTQIRLLADQFGMTTNEVQKYKYAADQAGQTTHQMVTAFKILANHMGASGTLTGMQHSIKMFGQYGMSTRDAQGKMKGLPEMLGDIADRMSKMDSAAQRVRFANEMMGEMGFRMIPMLMQGRQAIEAMFKDFDKLNMTMSEDFVQSAFITGQKVKTLRTAFQVWKSEIAQGVFPFVQALAGKLTHMASNLTGLARRTTWMTTAWIAFGVGAAMAILRVVGGLQGLWSLMSRFLIPVAIITLLYLIFDDLFALMTGKKSLIGTVLDELFGAGTAAQFADQLNAIWREIVRTFDAVKPVLTDVFKILLDAGVKVIPYLVDGFIYLVKIIGAAVTLLGTFVQALVKTIEAGEKVRKGGGSWGEALFGRKGALGSLMAPEGEAGNLIENNLDKIFSKDYWKMPERRPEYGDNGRLIGPPRAQGGGGGQTNIITVNVDAQDDPKKTGKEIGRGIKDELFQDEIHHSASMSGLYGAF